jgi:tetratricopeptide (TPR) repeat protein
MSRKEKPRRSGPALRLNRWALLSSIGAIALLILGLFVLSGFRGDQVRKGVLTQVQELEEAGRLDLALRHVDRYLANHPDDIPVLEIQARLLTEIAGTPDRIQAAIQANERLLRLDPESPGRQDNRKWLVELYLRLSEGFRSSDLAQVMPELATSNQRYRAASVIARDRIRRGADDLESRRLLAMTLEGLARAGDQKVLEEAIGIYQEALKQDPGDVVSAERLASLYLEQQDDQQGARRVIEALLEAVPESFEARLAAHRFYLRVEEQEAAAEALEDAARLAPDEDLTVRLAFIMERLRQGRVGEARLAFNQLPSEAKTAREAEVLQGMIEVAEERPDAAIQRWKQLLLASGGTDIGLTWTLSRTLIEVGRVSEALPLLEQFRRLGGEEAEPLYRFLRALASEKQGRFEQAIEDLRWAESRIEEAQQAELLVALGRCLSATGRTEAAEQAFAKAQAFDPEGSNIRLTMIETLYGNRPEQAAAEVERGLNDSPESPALWIALAKLRLREQLERPADQRNWTSLDRVLAELEKVAPESPDLPALQAERLLQEGRSREAAELLEEAVARFPQADVLWRALANSKVREGEVEEAAKILDRALAPEALGPNPAFLVAKAGFLASQGQGRAAAQVLTDGLEKVPADQKPLMLAALGRFHAARGARAEARATFLEWDRVEPEAHEPKLALLGLALADGDDTAAQEALRALRGSSSSPPVAWRLGRAEYLLRTGSTSSNDHLSEAARLIDEALAESPELPAVHRLKGLVLERQGDPEGAAEAYQQAWQRGEVNALRPLVNMLVQLDRAEALERLERSEQATLAGLDPDRLAAESYLRLGQTDRVRQFVNRALEASPDASTWAWQAAVLERLGQPEEVESALRSTISKQPDNLTPRIGLIRFLAGAGRLEEASQAVDETLKQLGQDRPATLEAELRRAAGDESGADRAFAEALRQNPQETSVELAAARFYEQTGRRDEAEAILRALLEREPDHRIAVRQLALLISERAGAELAAWQEAWDLLEQQPSSSPEDRLTKAIVLARHPVPDQRNAAIASLESLTGDLPPESNLAILSREALARLLIANDRPERAVEVASVSLTVRSNLDDLILYIEALLAAKRIDEVDRQLDRLQELAPGHPAGPSLLVRRIETLAGAADAPKALEKAYNDRVKGPDDEPFGRALVTRLSQLGTEAAPIAEALGMDLAKRFPGASWLPAGILARQDRLDEALELCRIATQEGDLADTLQAAQILLGIAANDPEGPPSAVVEILEDIVRQRSKEPGPRTALAMVRHLQGNYEDEVRLYRELLSEDPKNDLYRNNLAWALSEGLNQPDEALELIEESIRRQGKAAQLLDTRGAILTRLGRLDEAIEDFQEACRQMPEGSHLFRLARAYHKAGRVEEAKATMAKALEVGLTAQRLEPSEREEFQELMKL